MTQRVVELGETLSLERLFGVGERHLRRIREKYGVRLVARGNVLKVIGSDKDVREAHALLSKIVERLKQDISCGPGDIDALLETESPGGGMGILPMIPHGRDARATWIRDGDGSFRDETDKSVFVPCRAARKEQLRARRAFTPKTAGQQRYVGAIAGNDIVFSIGPAGTGKTFLGVAMALEALRKGTVRKLVLARPAVEAGEKLGFLPGDFHAKVNPYLRPLYDALNNLLEYDQVRRLIETEVVEIVPLAYMRGRTLDEAFIILDEAQNTTSEQMKMFLTRMGVGSKIVVTGDITQIDLPEGKISGLVQVQSLLKDVEGIAFSYLGKEDIVRHRLVQKIVEAYEKVSKGRRR